MTYNNQLLRYYCTNCNSILKESPVELYATPSDVCPKCGSFLEETLRIDPSIKKENEAIEGGSSSSNVGKKHKQQQAFFPLKTAFDLSVPSFGISALDGLVGRFTSSLCLMGDDDGCGNNSNSSNSSVAEALFWRALIFSLLPQRNGGSGFSKILLIDAGNCSDIYLCVEFARQLGLNLDRLLDGIIVTRAFTIYQLASLVRNAGKAARMFGADMIAVADMTSMFVNDPHVTQSEENRIADRISDSLAQASSQTPVLAFLSSSSFRSTQWLVRFDMCIEASSAADEKHVVLLATHAGQAEGNTSALDDTITLQQHQIYQMSEQKV